jgi:hypothetical protein
VLLPTAQQSINQKNTQKGIVQIVLKQLAHPHANHNNVK